MRILIAPNAFKNSLDAVSVADAIAKGILQTLPKAVIRKMPIADGGDGTLKVLSSYYKADVFTEAVHNPLFESIHADWALDQNIAFIEMALASGIQLISSNKLNPKQASSDGTGELIAKVLGSKREVSKIILGVGGSATVDGGTGMLRALGAKFYDEHKEEIKERNALLEFDQVDWKGLDVPKGLDMQVLCDVENPVIGNNGAARIFGPQKGADKETIVALEQGMEKWMKVLEERFNVSLADMPRGGAAGGIAAACYAVFGAKLTSGIEYMMEIMGIEKQLQQADLIFTAEGKVDASTISGKGPAGIAKRACAFNKPVICLAGHVSDVDQLNSIFDVVLPITNGPKSLDDLLLNTAEDLERTSGQLTRLIDQLVQ